MSVLTFFKLSLNTNVYVNVYFSLILTFFKIVPNTFDIFKVVAWTKYYYYGTADIKNVVRFK